MLMTAHRPVLTSEVVAALAPRSGAILLDATLGGGGHAEAILAAALPPYGVRLLGTDRDGEAVARTRARIGGRVETFQASFREIPRVLAEMGIDKLDGLLADLGVSSDHLDAADRGFSFRAAGPIDMRMDPTSGRSLRERLEEADEETLAQVIRTYGEEPRARLIARRILDAREGMSTTMDLAEIVAHAVGGRRGKIHPATRTFQALRIWVNDELGELEALLDLAPRLLAGGGRLVILSYHSLEDRMIKIRMKEWKAEGRAQEISKHVTTPAWSEVKKNPRARSAKMRTASF